MMGTTVTTNLGLIKPDVNESIEANMPTFAGWAAQNASNCDAIDALFRASTHTYTPTWTATGGNPTLGAGGSVTGKYIRLYPRMVIGQISILTGGAGFLTGTGAYNVSAPAAALPDSAFATFQDSIPVGKAILLDSDAVVSSSLFQILWSVTTSNFFFRPPNASSWTDANPIVLGQNDRLTGYFQDPTAAA